jgi:hypothetical protein
MGNAPPDARCLEFCDPTLKISEVFYTYWRLPPNVKQSRVRRYGWRVRTKRLDEDAGTADAAGEVNRAMVT